MPDICIYVLDLGEYILASRRYIPESRGIPPESGGIIPASGGMLFLKQIIVFTIAKEGIVDIPCLRQIMNTTTRKLLDKFIINATKLSPLAKAMCLMIGIAFIFGGVYAVDFLKARGMLHWWGLLLLVPFYIGFRAFYQSRVST